MTTIILLAIVGAIIAAVVGTFWYSDETPMGRIHMRSLGLDKLSEAEKQVVIAKAKPMMPKMYAGQLSLSLLTAFATVFIITLSIRNGISFGMALGFIAMNWLCFVVPTIGGAILWSNTDREIAWQKFFSDIFSSLVTLVLIAVLASFFV